MFDNGEAMFDDGEAMFDDREAMFEDEEAMFDDREAMFEDREAMFDDREAMLKSLWWGGGWGGFQSIAWSQPQSGLAVTISALGCLYGIFL